MIEIQTYTEDIHKQYLLGKQKSVDDLRIYYGVTNLIKCLSAQSDFNSGKIMKRKFCLDAFSMYMRLHEGLNITVITFCQEARLITPRSTKERRLANIVLNFVAVEFVTELIIVFPKEGHEETNSKSKNLIEYLIELDDEEEISEEYKLAMKIYQRIFSYMFSQIEIFHIHRQVSPENVLITLELIRCPWINNKIINKDPCAAQMAYFAQQNYTCFTWNEYCLQSIPLGVYIIGFNYTLFYQMQIQDIFYDKRAVWISSYDSEIINEEDCKEQQFPEKNLNWELTFWERHIKINEEQSILCYSSKNLVNFKMSKPNSASKYSLFSSNIFIQEAFKMPNKNRYLVDFQTWNEYFNNSLLKAFIAYMIFQIHPILKINKEKGIFKEDVQICNHLKIIYEKDVDPSDEIAVYENNSQNALVVNENFSTFLALYFPRTGLHSVFSSNPVRRTVNNPERSPEKRIASTERKLFSESTTGTIVKTAPSHKNLNNRQTYCARIKKNLFRESTGQKIRKITKLRVEGSRFTSDFDSDSDIEEEKEKKNKEGEN